MPPGRNNMHCPALPCPAFPALPFPALPCPALPFLPCCALLCPALPSLPCQTQQVSLHSGPARTCMLSPAMKRRWWLEPSGRRMRMSVVSGVPAAGSCKQG